MDLREGQNITRPPLLEGNKYGYWRVRMKAFLKSQDESVWEAVENGWTHPVTTKAGKVNLLAKDKWTEIQKNTEAANSKAMNVIFSGVDGKNFKMISTCEVAKKAWDILQTAHEGTTKVKISRMEMVKSKFENLRMQEDETIADFNTRVLDISNESFALGEPMSEETLVRKMLRSLPKRYAMKALAVKKAHDVRTMRLDELMGSLQAHQMEMEMEMEMDEEEQHKKVKCVGLQSEVTNVLDKEGEMSEQLYVMMARNFMRRLNNEGSDPGDSSNSRIQKEGKFQRKYKSGDYGQDNKGKGIQCKECEGYGHFQAECVNTRKKKNAYAIKWSDNESNQADESNNFVALASCVNRKGERSEGVESKLSSEDHTQYSSCGNDEEITEEDFTNNYRELFQQWLIEVEQNKRHRNNLADLKEEKGKLREEVVVLVAQKVEHQQAITDLKAQLIEIKDERAELVAQKTELLEVVSSLKIQIETSQGKHPEIIYDLKKKNDALQRREVNLLNIIEALKCEIETEKLVHTKTLEELNNLKKSVKMLNSGTKDLEDILGAQRTSGGYKGLGFTGAYGSEKTTFVKAELQSHVVSAEHLPRRKATWYPSRKQKQNVVRRRDERICYYCNKRGHIKPRCYEFLSYLKKLKQKHSPQVKQVWRVKQRSEKQHVAPTPNPEVVLNKASEYLAQKDDQTDEEAESETPPATSWILQPSRSVEMNHPFAEVIGEPNDGIQTQSKQEAYLDPAGFTCFISTVITKNIKVAVYRLKKAPRAWCERLNHGYVRGGVDTRPFFVKHVRSDTGSCGTQMLWKKQQVDIFTKALNNLRFETPRSSLGLCVIDN
ncbi:unnamed protein product [Rhodiola kirilowii]